MGTSQWTKAAYNSSVSSRCWWFTPYGDGWEGSARHGADMQADDELREIVEMERAVGGVPDWAQKVVETAINFLPPCGHYLFPRAYLEAVSAIGAQAAPPFIHGCYTVERERKNRMQDYLLSLDAWLAGATADAAARELAANGAARVDWQSVCGDLWGALGQRSEAKELLVERILHRQRWWLKSMVWDDDARDMFCRDQYLGDTGCEGDTYGNPDFADPYLAESASPRVQRIEARLAELRPDWESFQALIQQSWLCAPKAFRFLERVVWAVGKGSSAAELGSQAGQGGARVPGFLRCEDTYPNADETARWWPSFVAALRAWWREQPRSGEVAADTARRLGDPTPVKRWLVRLLVRKLELYGSEELAKLVRAQPGTKRGTARPRWLPGLVV